MNYIILPYAKVGKNLIEEGDVLLFRGSGIVSYVIQRFTHGRYSHAAMASWRCGVGSALECVEFREWKGARVTSLASQVALNSGLIDVYRPTTQHKSHRVILDNGHSRVVEKETTFDGSAITAEFRELTGLPYSWSRIWHIFISKLFFHTYILKQDDDDVEKKDLCFVCSTSIAWLFAKHYVDLVTHCPARLVDPSALSRSPVLTYLFTLEDDSDSVN